MSIVSIFVFDASICFNKLVIKHLFISSYSAPAIDCAKLFWDMGSRNKVKILKGNHLSECIIHLTYYKIFKKILPHS